LNFDGRSSKHKSRREAADFIIVRKNIGKIIEKLEVFS